MSVMDKFLNIMKLNEGEDDSYYDEDDDGYLDEADSKDDKVLPIVSHESAEETKKKSSGPIQIRQQPKKLNTSGMEVCVIKPTSVEDAREITETLLKNKTVILNLEGLDVEIAQRIIDFTSGSCYAIHGNLQKISHYIFIITPASVDISGDFQSILSGSFDVASIHN